jgi:glucose/arabinose dehydrogenase
MSPSTAHLVRLVLNGQRVAAEEKLLADRKARIRFVRQAPDGSIYVIAGSDIWRLTPKK